jgi:hypothetical protein
VKNIFYYEDQGMGVLKEVRISCQEAVRETRAMARQFAVYVESDQAALKMFMDMPHRYNAVVNNN